MQHGRKVLLPWSGFLFLSNLSLDVLSINKNYNSAPVLYWIFSFTLNKTGVLETNSEI